MYFLPDNRGQSSCFIKGQIVNVLDARDQILSLSSVLVAQNYCRQYVNEWTWLFSNET